MLPFDEFLSYLKCLIQQCYFDSQEDTLLKAQIALGVYSKTDLERLLRDDATLNKMLD